MTSIEQNTAETEPSIQKKKVGRPRCTVPKIKKTLSVQLDSQSILDRLRMFHLRNSGRRPSEGEIIDMLLSEKAEALGLSVN